MATRAPERQASELLKVSEAAELLHVHPNTLRRWDAQGLLVAWRVGSRKDRRFARSEVLALLTPGASAR